MLKIKHKTLLAFNNMNHDEERTGKTTEALLSVSTWDLTHLGHAHPPMNQGREGKGKTPASVGNTAVAVLSHGHPTCHTPWSLQDTRPYLAFHPQVNPTLCPPYLSSKTHSPLGCHPLTLYIQSVKPFGLLLLHPLGTLLSGMNYLISRPEYVWIWFPSWTTLSPFLTCTRASDAHLTPSTHHSKTRIPPRVKDKPFTPPIVKVTPKHSWKYLSLIYYIDPSTGSSAWERSDWFWPAQGKITKHKPMLLSSLTQCPLVTIMPSSVRSQKPTVSTLGSKVAMI